LSEKNLKWGLGIAVREDTNRGRNPMIGPRNCKCCGAGKLVVCGDTDHGEKTFEVWKTSKVKKKKKGQGGCESPPQKKYQ
jgi:hypothetical protein